MSEQTAREDAGRGSETPCQNTTPLETALATRNQHFGSGVLDESSDIRAVSPITVDGGTRFVLQLREQFAPSAAARALLRRLEHGAHKGQVLLPIDPGGVLDAPPHAQFIVSGADRQVLTFLVPDLAWFRLHLGTRQLQLQLKAKGLWLGGGGSVGYTLQAGFWLASLYRLFAGGEPENVYQSGWKMTGLELCCDFVGLDLYRSDAGNFVGARTNGDDGEAGERVTVWGGVEEAVQTINVGKRNSPISLCIYDKQAQIDAAKAGDGSTYEAVHRELGWDGDSKITRVELRFSGRGLCFDKGDRVLDFRDPITATSDENLAALWTIATHKRRLIVPGSSTRKERSGVDARWSRVQDVASIPMLPAGWRQRREVQKDTHRNRVERSRVAGLRALARYGVLHGIDLQSLGMKAVLRDLVADALFTSPDLDLEEYAEEYAGVQRPVLADEISVARDRIRARHALRLGKGRGK